MPCLPSISASLLLLIGLTAIRTHAWQPMGTEPGCPAYSTLLPRNAEYRKHCEGPDSDPHWPCFTLWYGDLGSVTAILPGGDTVPDDHFLLKDGNKIDFTTRDPKQPFTLSWLFDDVELAYDNFDAGSGCYRITLRHQSHSRRRIWVSDEHGKDRDIDTDHHGETSKTLCDKWVHVHVKEDGGT
uniref:Mig1 protein n=2 Tax=Kalmanozyma brasiliensis (strain GHG001) TaxID=1365824 RepID=V5EJR9_KALBG